MDYTGQGVGTNNFATLTPNVQISFRNQFGSAIIADCNGDPNTVALQANIYDTGCLIWRNDVFSGNNLYRNNGTLASPSWVLVGSGGGGITSINGDTSAAQTIAAGAGISVVSAGGTTTITNTGGSGAPIYPDTLIPFGDGSTPGGITTDEISFVQNVPAQQYTLNVGTTNTSDVGIINLGATSGYGQISSPGTLALEGGSNSTMQLTLGALDGTWTGIAGEDASFSASDDGSGNGLFTISTANSIGGAVSIGVNASTGITFNGASGSYTFPQNNAAGALTNNGSGTLTWGAIPSGSITGTATQIPYFDATTGLMTSDANFTRNNAGGYDYITNITATDGIGNYTQLNIEGGTINNSNFTAVLATGSQAGLNLTDDGNGNMDLDVFSSGTNSFSGDTYSSSAQFTQQETTVNYYDLTLNTAAQLQLVPQGFILSSIDTPNGITREVLSYSAGLFMKNQSTMSQVSSIIAADNNYAGISYENLTTNNLTELVVNDLTVSIDSNYNSIGGSPFFYADFSAGAATIGDVLHSLNGTIAGVLDGTTQISLTDTISNGSGIFYNGSASGTPYAINLIENDGTNAGSVGVSNTGNLFAFEGSGIYSQIIQQSGLFQVAVNDGGSTFADSIVANSSGIVSSFTDIGTGGISSSTLNGVENFQDLTDGSTFNAFSHLSPTTALYVLQDISTGTEYGLQANLFSGNYTVTVGAIGGNNTQAFFQDATTQISLTDGVSNGSGIFYSGADASIPYNLNLVETDNATFNGQFLINSSGISSTYIGASTFTTGLTIADQITILGMQSGTGSQTQFVINDSNVDRFQFWSGGNFLGGIDPTGNLVSWSAYPSTRDDSGTFAPVSFLYTDTSGNVLEAPLSALPASSIFNYTFQTGTYSILSTDYTIDNSGTYTVTLPDATTNVGKVYIIKNSGVGTITLACTVGGQTIDGNLTQTIISSQAMQVQSTGSNYIIIN